MPTPVTLLRRLAARRSVNLAFHGVAPRRPGVDPEFLWRDPERFRADVRLFQQAGFAFVTVSELADRLQNGVAPPGLATLSFDDGMQDNHENLLPLLRELGVPATVYVVTGLIGRPNPWMHPDSGARMMTEDELLELHEAGIELGAHTVTHPDLSTLDHAACLREMTESRAAIERLTGAPVRTFAYPFCRFGPEAERAARDAGFAVAVTCLGNGTESPWAMERAMITGKDGTASVVTKALGIYQPVFYSRVGRLGRGATRGLRTKVRARFERT